MLKFHTRFSRTWWICPNIVLELGFPEVLGLAVIPYYFPIRDFLNSWPINYYPWSYMISIGLGYLVNHVVYTKFDIVIALLLSYCVILDHPVTGSIMVMAFRFKFYFCPFIIMTYGPMIYTHILLHGISSSSLASNLPYFVFEHFVHWKVSQLVNSFRTDFLMMVQYKCW